MINTKTANKKRKSIGNADESHVGQSPAGDKSNISIKTPDNSKGNATPGKANRAFKGNAKQNNTPKLTPAQRQQTPRKPQEQNNNSAKKGNKKVKRSNESENDSSPAKKLKMFGGTSTLEELNIKKEEPNIKKEELNIKKEQPNVKKEQPNVKKEKPQPKARRPQVKKERADGKKKKGQFFNLRQKLNTDKAAALADIEKKIKAFGDRKELTKTAKRKLKLLIKLKRVATGVKTETKPPSAPKKGKDKKKPAKGAGMTQAKGGQKKPKPTQQKPVIKKEEEEDDSEYEVEAEIKPDKIIMTSNMKEEQEDESENNEEESEGDEEEESDVEEESDEDDDDDDEEEESSEAESGEETSSAKTQIGKKDQSEKDESVVLKDLKENNKKQSRYITFVGNIPYDVTKEEILEHFKRAGAIKHIRIPLQRETNKPRGFAYVELFNENSYQKALSLHHTILKGRRINVLYTQGGKKASEGTKNAVKVKNFKLQAMRKQGQLAGSVKPNQNRAARRAKRAQVNGA